MVIGTAMTADAVSCEPTAITGNCQIRVLEVVAGSEPMAKQHRHLDAACPQAQSRNVSTYRWVRISGSSESSREGCHPTGCLQGNREARV